MQHTHLTGMGRLGAIALLAATAACARTATTTEGGDVAPANDTPAATMTPASTDSAVTRADTAAPATSTADTSSSAPTDSASSAATSTGSAGAGPTVAPSTTVAPGNIAAILTASNLDEVQTSQIALQRASNGRVKAFAQSMVDEHRALHQNMEKLLQKKTIQPDDNETSQQMKGMVARTLIDLSSRSGDDFDRAYIAHQVQSHTTTLQLIDRQLLPSAADAEMKAMLRDQVRPRVAKHLAEALQLQQGLQSR